MEIIRIILDLVIILLGLWIIFFKSYFKEKGKNIATKEDIKEITSKIESVKLDYLKKSELNKYELELNYELFNALNTLQNVLRTLNDHKTEPEFKLFWENFETSLKEIRKLHINYSSTYYSHYQSVGSNFEYALDNFIKYSKSQEKKDPEAYLKNINELLNMIEQYKKEIYGYIKK